MFFVALQKGFMGFKPDRLLVTSLEFTQLKRHCLALLHPEDDGLTLERLSPLGDSAVAPQRSWRFAI